MSQKKDLIELLSKKEQTTLTEIYAQFKNKSSIRGTLNLGVKNGEIVRFSKGLYGKKI